MSAEDAAESIRSILDGDSVAVVGGTTWEEEGHTEPLRESDQQVLQSEKIDIDNVVEAVYGVSGEELVNAVGDRNVYLTGGTVANPYARLVNADIDPSEVSSVDFGKLITERRFPFTFDDEGLSGREILSDRFPEDSETVNWYSMPVEEFRKNGRPNYVVDRSYGDDGAEVLNEFERIFVTDADGITELEEVQKEEYLSKRFTPVANGNDWQTDYSILGVHVNPHADGNVVAAQGAHHLGTEGANDLIKYPESDIQGTETVLDSIDAFQEETGAEQYQALVQTYRNPASGEIQNNLIAIGEL